MRTQLSCMKDCRLDQNGKYAVQQTFWPTNSENYLRCWFFYWMCVRARAHA